MFNLLLPYRISNHFLVYFISLLTITSINKMWYVLRQYREKINFSKFKVQFLQLRSCILLNILSCNWKDPVELETFLKLTNKAIAQNQFKTAIHHFYFKHEIACHISNVKVNYKSYIYQEYEVIVVNYLVNPINVLSVS